MNDDDLTTRLGRELHTRSDVMQGSSLALADVQHKARSIRRRRSATAAGGAALAVALVVPVAALLNHHGHTNEPLPAVTQSVTPDPSPSTGDGQQPPDGVLDVSDLPAGEAPGLEYVTGARTLHVAGGGEVDIPTRYPVHSFVALQDGSHVWQTVKGGLPYVEVEDGDGGLVEPVRSDWGLAVNPAHTIAAWTGPDRRVHVLGVDDSAPSVIGGPITDGYDRAVAAVTGADCAVACTVYVNVSGQQGALPPWEVTPAGSQRLLDGDFHAISDVSEAGLTIGLDSVSEGGSCSKLLGGGEFQGFTTCRATLVSFSPDGSSILGYPPYYDGLGPTSLSLFDLEGTRVFERRSDVRHQATVAEVRWEDPEHLLAMTFQDGTWALVRIGTDGSMEYAVPPVSGFDVDHPYVLPTGGAQPQA